MASENIRLYIQKYGENQSGVLTVTTPSECLNVFEFQKKWNSWLSNGLKKTFPTGMWVRERQPRSGNWHAHAIVNVGFDIKTGFPFDQVEKRFYANVDPRIRELWKRLRERGADYGFGRIELLPLKASGKACARYLTKYLAKAFGYTKSDGEEKCRLFGVWGGVRAVRSPFSFVNSRIMRKRKEWMAAEFDIADLDGFKRTFGFHWWFHLGSALRDVILPEEFYKVRVNGELAFDDLGFRAYCEDLEKYSGSEADRVIHSRYLFFTKVGELIHGGDSREAYHFATRRIGYPPPAAIVPLNPQLILDLKRRIAEEPF